MSWIKKMRQVIGVNVTEGTTETALKDYAWSFVGGAMYPVFPTVLQRIFPQIDLTGLPGASLGFLGTTLTGLLAGKPGITCAGIGAFTAHAMYAVANDKVVYPVLGTYLFRWDPAAMSTFADDAPLQAGARYEELPDGRKIPVYDDVPPSPVSDYIPSLPGAQTGMSDYVAALPPATETSSYTNSIETAASGLRDYVGRLPQTSSGYTDTLRDGGGGFYNSSYDDYM